MVNLVCPTALPSTDDEPICEMLTNIKDIETQFARMINDIKEEIIRNKTDVVSLLNQLRAVSAVKNEEVPLFDEDVFENVKSIDDFCKKLKEFCTIFNYELLEYIVEISECKEAQDILKEYLSKTNLSAIKDMDLLLCCKREEHWEGLLIPMLRIKVNIDKCTLNIKKSVERIVSKIYKLDKYDFCFKGIEKGIELLYYISKPLKLYLLSFEVTRSNMAELLAHDVIGLQINDDFELKIPPNISDVTTVSLLSS